MCKASISQIKICSFSVEVHILISIPLEEKATRSNPASRLVAKLSALLIIELKTCVSRRALIEKADSCNISMPLSELNKTAISGKQRMFTLNYEFCFIAFHKDSNSLSLCFAGGKFGIFLDSSIRNTKM